MTGVLGDQPGRLLERVPDDERPRRLVIGQPQLPGIDGLLRPDEGDAASRNDAFLDGRAGRRHRVLDPVLLLLELDLGGRADLDQSDAAGQPGQPLLQLLPVVVRLAALDLGPDLRGPPGDPRTIATAVDDRGVVLGHDHLSGTPEHVQADVLELDADLLGDDLAAREDGHVLEHRLTTIAEPGRLGGDGREGAPDLVHHQRGERLPLHVLGHDDQRLAGLDHLLQEGK